MCHLNIAIDTSIVFKSNHRGDQMLKRNKIITLTTFALLLIQGCRPVVPVETPTLPVTTASPSPYPSATPPAKHSVVLISWDASRADIVYGLMDSGQLPAFASVAAGGVRAEYSQTVDPSLTATAHNSIASGSYPSHTGIVSNSFHVVGDDFYWYRKGFDEPMDNAEPVWVTASRNGLITASVFFPAGTPSLRDQLADYTIGYGIQDAYSNQVKVALSEARGWNDVPGSFSTPLAGSFTIQNVGPVYLYVVDSSDDNVQNYDMVILNTMRSGKPPAQMLKKSEWGSLVLLEHSYAGAEFLIQDIAPDTVTLYHTGVEHNTASPKELLDALNQKFGFFPPGGDSYALEDGWITDDDFLYMLERQSTYMAEVVSWVYSTYRPDLLFTWQDPFDSAGHQFLMTDPRQYDYSAELAERYHQDYLKAASVADHSLSIMLDAFDLDNTTLLMVGDHGMAPIHSVVYVNTVLEQAGLLTLDSQSYVVLDQTKAFAIASGGAVHIYINLVGREKGGGTVTADEYPAVQQQIITLFTDLVDPDTGTPVFERVLARSELGPLGLDHPNSGDVFAQAVPGYHLDGWRGNEFTFAPAEFYGQHGYDSTLPEMHTIFIAAGSGIIQSGTAIPPVKVVDYAPTIAKLLDFDPASTVDGSAIMEILQP
jgi:predicted AlkP superfamily pyrophosphatase or phosphodiesterase